MMAVTFVTHLVRWIVKLQCDPLARGPKLLSITNYVIEIMTWKFIYTYRERCKTGPAHNRCWKWSPFNINSIFFINNSLGPLDRESPCTILYVNQQMQWIKYNKIQILLLVNILNIQICAVWRCMHRASSYNMYTNQQDAQNSCD